MREEEQAEAPEVLEVLKEAEVPKASAPETTMRAAESSKAVRGTHAEVQREPHLPRSPRVLPRGA